MNQQKGLARGAGPAIADFTEPEFLDTRSRTDGLRAAAPVGYAVDPANRVGPEAFHGAHIGLQIQRAEVIFWAIGRQSEQARVGSDGGEEKDGENNGEDENWRRFAGEEMHFGDLQIASRQFLNRSIFFSPITMRWAQKIFEF